MVGHSASYVPYCGMNLMVRHSASYVPYCGMNFMFGLLRLCMAFVLKARIAAC